MKDFKNKVAVVTGAASGLGRAVVERCAREGMKIVLADIEEPALKAAAEELSAAGATVLPVRTDVSNAADIEALAEQAYSTFGVVHLLMNNAGVAEPPAPIWERTIADWEWVLGVNLWSVIYGLQTFVPRMMAQEDESHIVNTASIAGVLSTPGLAAYNVTKHGVVTLSETLYHDLALRDTRIGVSVLCPAWVKTKIFESERNRPGELQNDPGDGAESGERQKVSRFIHGAMDRATMTAAEVADEVFEAIGAGQFYIFTHPRFMKLVKIRADDILEGRNPTGMIR